MLAVMHLGAVATLLHRHHDNKTIQELLRRVDREKLIGTLIFSDPATGKFWHDYDDGDDDDDDEPNGDDHVLIHEPLAREVGQPLPMLRLEINDIRVLRWHSWWRWRWWWWRHDDDDFGGGAFNVKYSSWHMVLSTGGHNWYPFSSKCKQYADGRLQMLRFGSWVTSAGFADFYVVEATSPRFDEDYMNLSSYLLYKVSGKCASALQLFHWSRIRPQHIVAATLLTQACFPNVGSFCHALNICQADINFVSWHKICFRKPWKHFLCLRGAQRCCRVLRWTGNIVAHNFAATMCPRFAGALFPAKIIDKTFVHTRRYSLVYLWSSGDRLTIERQFPWYLLAGRGAVQRWAVVSHGHARQPIRAGDLRSGAHSW